MKSYEELEIESVQHIDEDKPLHLDDDLVNAMYDANPNVGYDFSLPEPDEKKKEDNEKGGAGVEAYSKKFQTEMHQLYMKNQRLKIHAADKKPAYNELIKGQHGDIRFMLEQ